MIPTTLQTDIVNLAHEGHPGIVKTKQLLREKVWFPRLDTLVEQRIKNCLECQSCVADHSRPPVMMSQLPDQSWSHLSADFKGPLSDGTYILVIMDDYSRYPVIEFTNTLKATSIIPIFD